VIYDTQEKMIQSKKPHFILSKQKVKEQYEKVRAICDQVSYSTKTNPIVANILEKSTQDCFFSVHSFTEAQQIKDKKRVWFFAQGWDEEDIKEVLSLGITKIVVDNERDLNSMVALLDNMSNSKIDLLLRMKRKEHTIHTGKHFVFGMYSSQVKKWIPELRKKQWVNKLGVHVHRKTQNVSEWSIKYELKQTFDKPMLDSLDIINIGGGFPIRYKNYSVTNLDEIFAKIKECRAWLHEYGIKLYAEPGRFIAGPAVKLVTYIVNIYNDNIIVNTSIFHGALDTFIADTRLLVQGEITQGKQGKAFTIKGNSPDSRDIFRYRVYLEDIQIGDNIVFINAGAYNFHTDFFSAPKLETKIVH